MKQILFAALILLNLLSCNPPNLYKTGTIAIKAQVINPQTNINLGDSVAFYFEVPDTIELDGSRIKVDVGNNDGGNIGFNPQKIIPSLPGGFSNNPSLNTCKVYANPGYLTRNETLHFTNAGGKILAKYYMIPQQKGVYFLDQSQEGYIDLNNNSLKLRFSINFGNINRNHQMLIDSAGVTNNFNLFLQDHINNRREIYGFKVN